MITSAVTMFPELTGIPVIVALTTIAVGIAVAVALIAHRTNSKPQHAGGDGALTVWHLIAHVEAERQRCDQGGRHRLHESRLVPSASDETRAPEPNPPLELQQRILDALRAL